MEKRRERYAEEVGGGAELGGAAEEEGRRAALRPLEEAAARCRALGGEPVPAHADAESYSVFAMLGMLPPENGR